MKITALLPMKGHSERVPNKNMRLFNGQPLYHQIAKTLQDSSLIDSILVNTDSKIIAEDAAKYFSKIRIIDRPEKLQGDTVPMNEIIEFDLSVCDSNHFIQTHSTNPLLKKETLKNAIENYFNSLSNYDSIFSVTKLQTRLYDQSGKPVNHDPRELLRTQDLPLLFEENSNIFIFSKDSFYSAGKKRIGEKPKMFTMDKLEAIDIDEEKDFILAETLMRMRQKE